MKMSKTYNYLIILIISFINLYFLNFLFSTYNAYALENIKLDNDILLNYSFIDLYRSNLNMTLYYTNLNVFPTMQKTPKDKFRINLYYFTKNRQMRGLSVNRIITLIPNQGSYNISEQAITFSWDVPSLVYGFKMYEVITKNKQTPKLSTKVTYPLSLELIKNKGLEKYIQPSPHIDSDNQNIIKLANHLLFMTKDNDLLSIAYNLANYVHNNIKYDNSPYYTEQSLKASEVLKQRHGVCDEFTSLFIALARALNIPARVVSGISYTNSRFSDKPLGYHAWAQLYFPGYGWIDFDPTYGEYYDIDISHIALDYNVDPGEPSVQYEWQSNSSQTGLGSSASIEHQFNLSVQRFYIFGKRLSPNISYDLSYMADRCAPGSYNVIVLSIHNNEDYYLIPSITLSRGDKIKLIRFLSLEQLSKLQQSNLSQLLSNQSKPNADYNYNTNKDPYNAEVLLKPHQNTKLYWIIKIDKSLDNNMLYSFTNFIVDNYGHESNASLVISPNYAYNDINDVLNFLEMEKIKSNRHNNRAKYAILNKINFNCSATSNDIYPRHKTKFICDIYFSEVSNQTYKWFLGHNLSLCYQDSCLPINITQNKPKQRIMFYATFDKYGTYINSFVLMLDNTIGMKKDIIINIKPRYKLNIISLDYPKTISFKDRNKPIVLSFVIERTKDNITSPMLTLNTGSSVQRFDISSFFNTNMKHKNYDDYNKENSNYNKYSGYLGISQHVLDIKVPPIYLMNNKPKYVEISYYDLDRNKKVSIKRNLNITIDSKDMNLFDRIMLFIEKIFS